MTGAVIALAGAVVLLVLRIVYDRGAEIRARKLETAATFLAKSHEAIDAVELTKSSVFAKFDPHIVPVKGAKPPEQAVRDLHPLDASLELQLVLVHLVFGENSVAGKSAKDLREAIRKATQALETVLQMPGVRHEPMTPEEFMYNQQRYIDENWRVAWLSSRRFGAAARADFVPLWTWWARPKVPSLEELL